MRNFENWLNAYLAYSDNSEAPEMFHFWTGISVIAGALRRKVWIDMKYFQWTPNMYIVFVAPPGIVSKSTTAAIGMNLLRQVEGIKFGPDACTWQSLVMELQESQEMFQLNEGDEEYHTMSAITVVSSEFGNFLNPSDREMVDALVSLWDGQVGIWAKKTKTQGNDRIENPWINVLACTTPDWIAGNFPDYLVGGGFTSRTIFVYADKKRKLVPYPKFQVSQDFDEMQLQLVQDLGHIANNIAGEYHLSGPARLYGEQWYSEHYNNPPPDLEGERFGGYLARKQTHVHKLAMVLAASESDKLTIERHHLVSAAGLVSTLEKDMPKVFNRIGVKGHQKEIKALVNTVWAKGEMTKVALWAQAFAKMDYKTFNDAMVGATAGGFIIEKQKLGEIIYVKGRAKPE